MLTARHAANTKRDACATGTTTITKNQTKASLMKMTANKDETLHSLIGIQPKHLRLIQLHLNQYFRLLSEQMQEGDDFTKTTISELRYLDVLISGIFGDDFSANP
jgi:hypothetical protein